MGYGYILCRDSELLNSGSRQPQAFVVQPKVTMTGAYRVLLQLPMLV